LIEHIRITASPCHQPTQHVSTRFTLYYMSVMRHNTLYTVLCIETYLFNGHDRRPVLPGRTCDINRQTRDAISRQASVECALITFQRGVRTKQVMKKVVGLLYTVSQKTNSQNCCCHNFVKFLLTLIISGKLMADEIM